MEYFKEAIKMRFGVKLTTYFLFFVFIFGGNNNVTASEIIIHYEQNAKDAAVRFERQIRSLAPDTVINICAISSCEQIKNGTDSFVSYFIRTKNNYVEVRFETSSEVIEDEILFFPDKYIPVTKFPARGEISSTEKVYHLNSLLQIGAQQDNNALYKLLGDASFEASRCSHSDFDTLQIIVFSELIAKECGSGLLSRSLAAYLSADVCNNSLECLPDMTRIVVLLSYLSPDETIVAFAGLHENIGHLKKFEDRVMVRKRAMELNIIDQDYDSLCSDIKIIFSSYSAKKKIKEIVRNSSSCLNRDN
ncbi:hypothetical protein [Kiloniella litopenaei]|uniref:hypothetical protein n=1 Tax=Kiloniella litopenaei TaxID=1549748 RepID=UPI003BA8BF30